MRYDAEKRRRTVEAVRAGATLSAAARAERVAVATVYRWCRDAGVRSGYVAEPRLGREKRRRVVEAVRGGASLQSTAHAHGVALATAYRWCTAAGVRSRHPSRAGPGDTRERILAWREREPRMSQAEIARRVGVSRQRVSEILRAAR